MWKQDQIIPENSRLPDILYLNYKVITLIFWFVKLISNLLIGNELSHKFTIHIFIYIFTYIMNYKRKPVGLKTTPITCCNLVSPMYISHIFTMWISHIFHIYSHIFTYIMNYKKNLLDGRQPRSLAATSPNWICLSVSKFPNKLQISIWRN